MSQLGIVLEADAYFHELITEAIQKRKMNPSKDTEFYLVNLLKQFILTENLFSRNTEGKLKDQPLALLLKEAVEEEEPSVQSLLYRRLGDVALYLSGVFQENLSRRNIDLGYSIGIGKVAYSQALMRVEEDSLKIALSEIGSDFGPYVEVISVVGEKTLPRTNESDLLKLYEVWMNTGSERAKKLLNRAGIQTASSYPAQKKKIN